MTNEEAIKFTDRVQREYGVSLARTSPTVLNWFKHVRVALERQIPKKPTRFKNAFWEGYSCPECSESVSIIDEDGYETPQYCKWCGVKLDWSDRDV